MQIDTPANAPAKSAKGKHDPPSADDVHSKQTLFIRDLPYSATSQDLEAFFSEIGPVRSSFVVADKDASNGEHRNKGFGFVTFALKEDAERAIQDLKKKKFMDVHRPVRVEFAVKKAIAKNRKADGVPVKPELVKRSKKQGVDAVPTFTKQQKPQDTPVSLKNTVVEIGGIPDGVTAKMLKHKVRKFAAPVSLIFPVDGQPGVARVTYSSKTEADAAAQHLDGHQYKGVAITAKVTGSQDKVFIASSWQSSTATSPQINVQRMCVVEAAAVKRARLIVRNIAWRTKESDLRTAFSPYGNIIEVTVPLKPDGKMCGFGFVQFEAVDEAEKAMDAINGTELLGRTVAVDWAVAKKFYETDAADGDAEEANKADGAQNDDDEEEDEDDEDEDEEEGEDEDGDEDMDQIPNDEDEDEDEDDGNDEDGDDDDGEDEEDDVEVTFDGERRPRKSGLPDPSEGRTLFIRNLAFETTEEDLDECFSAFGQVQYAVVTMDHNTGRSRGTGFVAFEEKSDADACLAAYAKATEAIASLSTSKETSKGADDKRKKNINVAKSVLLPEPSLTASNTAFILGGRFLNVTRAVQRDEATALAESGRRKRKESDKRNLYLMREGVIFPDSDAAKDIPPTELSKRQKSYSIRKRLLTVNPNLFISKTRLAIRNLSAKLDDLHLRQAATDSVREFWKDVEQSKREPLDKDVVEDEQKEGRGIPGKRRVLIKQAKILREKDKIDPATGKHRSKGCGFIEFANHSDALACLRWLNNNPSVYVQDKKSKIKGGDSTEEEGASEGRIPFAGGSKRRPIVEFAVENLQVLKKR
ncbi:uncharacterized protein BJ171DRAFT_425619, partial [Polychytrium aggregatum]|uniref:uncharacterized protein n=1 Tax=Polychytrium aggregatum TaxID=110093 RepID=UPI0022FEFBE4